MYLINVNDRSYLPSANARFCALQGFPKLLKGVPPTLLSPSISPLINPYRINQPAADPEVIENIRQTSLSIQGSGIIVWV